MANTENLFGLLSASQDPGDDIAQASNAAKNRKKKEKRNQKKAAAAAAASEGAPAAPVTAPPVQPAAQEPAVKPAKKGKRTSFDDTETNFLSDAGSLEYLRVWAAWMLKARSQSILSNLPGLSRTTFK